ncbi:MAG TPA: AraC family transcriptional regulator [Ktedonobacteraceae bacterium]
MKSAQSHPALAQAFSRKSLEIRQFADALANVFFAELLFDQMADVAFFVKDKDGRYIVVNQTLTQRCGCQSKHELLGHSPLEVFPTELGASYAAQDQHVLRHGLAITNQLELHLSAHQAPVWCLTHKIPLFDHSGQVLGLAGISRDLRMPDSEHPVYQQVARVILHIQQHYAEPLKLETLARLANLSASQLERHMQRIFDLTPKQLIIKTRLDAATRLLKEPLTISEIAHACGYTDHSAFTRQFRATVGLTPSEYRGLLRTQAVTEKTPE